MKYGNLAKKYLFERGGLTPPVPEDAAWLTDGEKKKFAAGQFEKFMARFLDLHDKTKAKLVKAGVYAE